MLRRELLSSAGLRVLAVALDTGEALGGPGTRSPSCTATTSTRSPHGTGPVASRRSWPCSLPSGQRNPYTITTFGGDLLSPSLMSGLTKGSQMIDADQCHRVQVAVLGNHEFDFGPELAAERIRPRATPGSAPTSWARMGHRRSAASTCSCDRGRRLQAGLLRRADARYRTLSSPGDEISFAAPPVIAAAAAKRLKEMGADVVVAMTHLYFADDQNLLAGIDGIDLVLGGHDHDPISFLEGDTLIAKAGSDMHYLAAIDLHLGRALVKDKEVVVVTPVLALSAHGRGDAGARRRGHRRALEHDARSRAGGAGRHRQGRARHPRAAACAARRPISATWSGTRCATPRVPRWR